MMYLITSVPSFPQKKVTVTEDEVREWARQIQECKADQRAFKFAAIENMSLADSLQKLRFEHKITKSELIESKKSNKNKLLTIVVLMLLFAGFVYFLKLKK